MVIRLNYYWITSGLCDCSHVVEEALKKGETPEGEKLKTGSTTERVFQRGVRLLKVETKNYLPRTKQREIERTNKGENIDKLLKPKSLEYKSKEKIDLNPDWLIHIK